MLLAYAVGPTTTSQTGRGTKRGALFTAARGALSVDHLALLEEAEAFTFLRTCES
jgi:hypothetical protein